MTRLCFSFKFKIQVRFGSKEALIVKTAEKAIPKIPPRVPDNTPNHLIPSTNNPSTPTDSFPSSIQTPTPPSSDTHPKITPEMLGFAHKFIVPGKLKTNSEKLAEKIAYEHAIEKFKAIVITTENIVPILKELGTNPVIKHRIRDRAIETIDSANELDLILINIFDNIFQKFQPNPIPQNIIEAFTQLINESLPPLQENIIIAPIISYADVDTMTLQQRVNNFLNDIQPKRCFTDQDRIREIARLKELLYLLKQENNIAESLFFEILMKAGIMTYPDIYFKEEDVRYNIPQSEGAKIRQNVYSKLQHSLKNQQGSSQKPSEEMMAQILLDIKEKNFALGILQRKTLIPPEHSNVAILSGQDLHFILVVKNTLNSAEGFIIGMFTSTNDKGTIELSKTQEINEDPLEKNKAQRFRFNTKLIKIHMDEFQEYEKVTTYAKGDNKEGKNVHQTIVKEFETKLETLKKNMIEYPFDFTLENLKILTNMYAEILIQEYNELLTNNLNIDVQKKTQDLQARQKKNQEKKNEIEAYKKNLTKTQRKLYEIREQLKQKKSLKEKVNKDDHSEIFIDENNENES